MPRSSGSVAGEALVTVAMLIGPAWLASWLGWPLGEHTTWTWLWQYLRGGTVPDEAVIAALVVILWGLWAAHLVVVALDVAALLRGLVPRVGLVRLVWVLAAGGATATSTHTAAVAAPTDTVAEAPTRPDLGSQEGLTPENRAAEQESGVIDRTRNLSGFAFDSGQLTPDMKESLEPTIAMISDFGLPEAPVVVTGHTDPLGDPAYNQALSEQRAQEVADYLAEHLGADAEFEIQGAGSSRPPDNPQASYGEHRRVEIAYTLQRPAAPAPEPSGEADQARDTQPAPGEVRLDVDPESERSAGPDLVVAGTVAGVAGAGVGYAAGRRHGHGPIRRRQRKPQADTHERGTGEDLPSGSTENPEPVAGELLREDPHGLARGVIDEDGYVLVADTVRVNGEHGIAFAGAHAGPVLAAVVTDHLQGPVIATRAVVTALGGSDALPPGAWIVPDMAHARTAVETEHLTAVRHRLDDEAHSHNDEQPSAAHPWVLVVGDASDLDAETSVFQELTAIPRAVVGVLGNPDPLEVTVQCDDLDRLHLNSPHGESDLPSTLRHRGLSDGSTGTDAHSLSPDSDAQEGVSVPETDVVPATYEAEECTPENSPSGEADARVRVRLFAPQLVCEVGGHEVLKAGRSSSRVLLGMMALRSQGLAEAELIEVLSPGKDPDKARKDKYNAISGLRSSLREALNTQEDFIFKRHGRYFLQDGFFDIDVRQAESLRELVERSEGDKKPILQELVSMWEQPLLSDSEEQWFSQYRKRYSDLFMESLVLLSKETEDTNARIRLMKRILLIDRLNEPIYQEVMRSYAELERPDAVQRTYRDLEEVLREVKKQPSQESGRLLRELMPIRLAAEG